MRSRARLPRSAALASKATLERRQGRIERKRHVCRIEQRETPAPMAVRLQLHRPINQLADRDGVRPACGIEAHRQEVIPAACAGKRGGGKGQAMSEETIEDLRRSRDGWKMNAQNGWAA